MRDLVWLILHKLQDITRIKVPSLSETSALLFANKITLIVCLLVLFHGLQEGLKTPALKIIEFLSPKIQKNQTLIFLSDIHIHHGISPEKIRSIVSTVNSQNPDFILLGGDIIDDKVTRIEPVVKLLAKLKAKKRIYFVLGNHEFYAGYDDSLAMFKNLGFVFLENSGTYLGNGIFLAGIPDRFSLRQKQEIDLSKAFRLCKSNNYKILLSHSPVDFKDKNNFDIELAGHTHGGQIFPNHIFVKLFNDLFLSGLYNLTNDAKIYVSNGAGQWGPQVRFLAPSEITVVKLVSKNGELN